MTSVIHDRRKRYLRNHLAVRPAEHRHVPTVVQRADRLAKYAHGAAVVEPFA
jgi:hypothetical protein